QRHRAAIADKCPTSIAQPLAKGPALEKHDFDDYPDLGYYTWLWKRMHTRDGEIVGEFGRFENLRSELLRLLRSTGTELTPQLVAAIESAPAANTSSQRDKYQTYYDPELRDLVADKDRYIIERFGYEF